MARSLRRPANEPQGSFTTVRGTRFTIRSGSKGTFQRMERYGGSAEYRVAYVIGSGSHASGYLIQVGGHLFQSPVCYYGRRQVYGLCPGYEQAAEPDFTRPVVEECVLCHAGKPLHVPGTINQYQPAIFSEEAISCERCHGPVEEHLKRPAPGNIVNPARLPAAARDSVCEQCHLTGATQRILNPGKDFSDFHAGQPLEDVFTVYVRAGAKGFKVIGHSEQLARSACARNSHGKLWCGTCHDPHPASPPTTQSYNKICRNCHDGTLAKTHTAAANCIGCHMQRRPALDGGHTVFTDHRITRRPERDEPASPPGELAAWREPPTSLQTRNLGLAYVNAGLSSHSPAEITRGYRMLAEVQAAQRDDVDVLKAIGRALLAAGQPDEALRAFNWVLRLTPENASSEEDVGIALIQSRQLADAAAHLERAVKLDPLLLSAGTTLEDVYHREGQEDKADALADRMRRMMLNLPKESK